MARFDLRAIRHYNQIAYGDDGLVHCVEFSDRVHWRPPCKTHPFAFLWSDPGPSDTATCLTCLQCVAAHAKAFT